MSSDLPPVKTQATPQAAMRVDPYANMDARWLQARNSKLGVLRWRAAPTPQAPGPNATQAEKDAYRAFYNSQTTVNGCTGVGKINIAGWKPWQTPESVAACNAHDIAYGRGGTEAERKAADDALFREIKEKDSTFKAWVTWTGVRIAGSNFFTYRDGGPLPIPEGQ
jgi:hypothetical protein